MGSCWSFKRNEDGSYANKNSSYLINLSMTNAETRFSDYEDIGSYATPAFDGSWLCSKV